MSRGYNQMKTSHENQQGLKKKSILTGRKQNNLSGRLKGDATSRCALKSKEHLALGFALAI